jgi:hypothetical protein
MFPIDEYRGKIHIICKALRVKRLELVGSASRGDFQSDRSDVDVLVEFEGIERLFDRYFELKKQLEHSLGRRVDVIQHDAVRNPYVRQTIDRDKVQIYGA